MHGADASSRFSMHPCLSVDEIIRFVACELVASEAKGTAVALGCCCRSFQDPVLDVLWEEQDRLAPLLECFPRDVWKEEGSLVCQLMSFIFSALTVWFRRLSRESRREQSGPVSVDMREECGRLR